MWSVLTVDETVETIARVNESGAIGYMIDRTVVRNIRVKGASVTVYGENNSQTGRVTVGGQDLPVDTNGAIGDYRSQKTTSLGERVTQITGFAADPGTIPAREEFRATGGSVYFLNRQDLSIGSERVRVEIRDKVTGLVVETRDLRPQEDYDVDYIQGRILPDVSSFISEP